MTHSIHPETVVLESDPPATYCPYCNQPFDTDQTCALHVGETHQDVWTDVEETAYEDALAAEDDELWVYTMKTVVGLALLYGVFMIAYIIALG